MQFIRKRVLAGEVMLGVGANLGSSLTVEMIGAAGSTGPGSIVNMVPVATVN